MTELKEGQKYFFAHNRDAETWSGPCDTHDEAVAEARNENPHGISYIGIGTLVERSEAVDYFDDSLLEWLEDNINDHLADNALGGDDQLASFRDPKAALEDLQVWADKHLVIKPWYQIEGHMAEEVKFAGRVEPAQ